VCIYAVLEKWHAVSPGKAKQNVHVPRCSLLIAHVCMRTGEGYSKPRVSAWQGHRGSQEREGEGGRGEEGLGREKGGE